MDRKYIIESSAYSHGVDYIATTLPGWQFAANNGHVLVEGSRADLKPRIALGIVECPPQCECRAVE